MFSSRQMEITAAPITRLTAPFRRPWNGLTLWMFCFIAGILYCWGMGVSVFDESWFLQVIRRVLDGGILYREICFEPTPLSVCFGAAACRIFGIHVLVTKALLAACFAFTVLFFVRAAGRLGCASTRWTLLAVAFFIVYCPVYPNSLYNPMAVMFMMLCLERCIAWIRPENDGDGTGDRRLVEAGIAAGFCLAAKQNIGLLAFAAAGASVLAAIPAKRRPLTRSLRPAAVLTLFFCLSAVVLILLPLLATGALASFVYQGVSSKVEYLRLALPYGDRLRELGAIVTHPSWTDLKRFYFQWPWIMPAITVPGLAAASLLLKGADRRSAALLFGFAGASWLSAYPRYDLFHLALILPAQALGLFFLGDRLSGRLSGRLRKAAWAACMAWLAVGTVQMGLHTARSFFGRGSCWSTLPHFSNVPIRCGEYRDLVSRSGALTGLTGDKKVFLLDVEAGFYYLTAGLRNPTPYDYPLTTVLGAYGREEVGRLAMEGRIPMVVVRDPHPAWGVLWPAELAGVIRTHMDAVRAGEWGTAYVPRPRPEPDNAGSH
jgi:hypothetical protein